MVQIDAHQHYWNPARGDYDWMPKDNATLARPYGPADLKPELERHGIGHTVLIQAAATVAETEYMLGIADATPSVAAVVGWIDFEKPGDLAHTEKAVQPSEVRGRPADDPGHSRRRLDAARRRAMGFQGAERPWPHLRRAGFSPASGQLS
jgi:predicted TIM-barrel fold metal-dependent hydrolase